MKHLWIILLFTCSISVAQTAEREVKNVLEKQCQEWNKGSIDGFMDSYWKSDSLLFIGKRGLQKGWQTTCDNYKKSYDSPAAMGKLSLNILHFDQINAEECFLICEWRLQREVGNLQGYSSIRLKKILGQWKIISDHSS